MQMLATEDKVKPRTGRTRDLNLVAARLTTVQETKLSLWYRLER